jgi:cell division protein FtsQ
VEIKRRKFGRKAWGTYLRVTMWTAAGLAGALTVYASGHFLLTSREMALVHPDQVVLAGNHFVPRASVLEIFASDRGKSVLRVPIDERRRQLEAIPWVEHATVRRVLPNHIDVEISERTPVAFLREGSDMALLDVHGVILDRPLEGNFHFPVVTGLNEETPLDDREQRMQLYTGFLQQIESSHPGASDQVSEVDLSYAHDVRATLTGLQGGAVISQGNGAGSATSGAFSAGNSQAWGDADAPVIVHFGDGDFAAKWQTLVENIGQWRATVGHVESIDLRYSREAVVNPDTDFPAPKRAAKPTTKNGSKTAKSTAAHHAKRRK